MKFWKEGLLAGGGVAACVACCALPLIPASLLAVGLTGAGFSEWGEKGLLYGFIAVGGSYGIWRWLNRAKLSRSQTSCGCTPAATGLAGPSCKRPVTEVSRPVPASFPPQAEQLSS